MKSEGQILQKKLAFKQLDDWKIEKISHGRRY